MKQLYFVTSNEGKFREVSQLLKLEGFTVVQKNLGYPELQATALEDVARFGLQHVGERFDKPFFLEDAGLFISGLNGFPGVYSAYVYYTIGLEGILRLMESLRDRSAVFRAVIGFRDSRGRDHVFIGECMGRIGDMQKGTQGFGYDPIFIPDGEDQTFAEMDTSLKNTLSHRAYALAHFIEFLTDKTVE